MFLWIFSTARGDIRSTATIGLRVYIKRMFPIYLPHTRGLGEYPRLLKLAELLHYPLFLHKVRGVISLSE